MSSSSWVTQGETLSLKNGCKEFGLTEEEIIKAIKEGKLQYKLNYAHGNPYYKLLRNEVESLAKELYGDDFLDKQKHQYELKKINSEINSLKRKLSSLEKQKAKLIESQK